MNSLKGLNVCRNVPRLLAHNNGSGLARNLSLIPRRRENKLANQSLIDDSFFSMASNIMRTLEREFDYARRQMERSFGSTFPAWPAMTDVVSRLSRDDLIRVDENGNRKFELALDMSEFEPEEIKIKTHGHNLNISAKREKKAEGSYFLREFTQSYSLPSDLKLEDLKSKWSDDGFLIIEAPLPKQIESKKEPQTRELKIEHGAKAAEQKLSEGGSMESGTLGVPSS